MYSNDTVTSGDPVTSSTKVKTVLIAEDHPIVREGYTALINETEDLEVCAVCATMPEAINLAQRKQPDVAIIDISLGGRSGLELIKELRTRFPEMSILTVSMHDESLYAEHSLRAGANGYLMKSEPAEALLSGIRRVLEGEIVMSAAMAGRYLNGVVGRRRTGGGHPMEQLTGRELEVFEMIGRGLGTRKIAESLHLSVKTVETHRARIKKKLQLDSSIDLVRHATQWIAGPSYNESLEASA